MFLELIAGSTLCVIGLSLLFPTRTWIVKGKWRMDSPSRLLTVTMIVLGIVTTAAGAFFLYLAAK